MNNKSNKRKTNKELNEDLAELRQVVESLVLGTNRALAALREGQNATSEVLDAVITIIANDSKSETPFSDKIVEQIKQSRIRQAKEAAEKDREQATRLLENGVIEPANTVTEESIIFGIEKKRTEDGGFEEIESGGLVQSTVSSLIPEVRDSIVGKKVGDSVPVASDRELFVTDIFSFTDGKPTKNSSLELVN